MIIVRDWSRLSPTSAKAAHFRRRQYSLGRFALIVDTLQPEGLAKSTLRPGLVASRLFQATSLAGLPKHQHPSRPSTASMRESAYHRRNEVPGLLSRARGRSRVMLIAWRQQIVDGQQPIVIALGCLALPGLVERALAHGASSITSWNRRDCAISSMPRSFFNRMWGSCPYPPIGGDDAVNHQR